ncbi:MAG: DUF4835 family protein [Muribaculaceae bacterium]|nr:DUF4835 family protein [Muribaculaceae bacterium]
MFRIKKTILVLLFASFTLIASSQELNCKVEINSDQVANVSKDVFKTLETAIGEYMNDTRWGNAQFMANEKIECKLFFKINSYADNVMTGDLQIQSMRPVYNSTYTTTLLNFKDSKIEFSYQENEPLVFSENTMESNITAILNFYAYLILGLDFDSYSSLGGDLYFDKATEIVRMAQSSGEKGWKAFEDTKNRSAVLSAYTDKSTSGLRALSYTYHRKGLDEMALSVDKGRASVTESLEMLKKIYDVAPMSVGLSMFKDAKLDELTNIYSKAGTSEKEKIYELLYPLYPTEGERLKKIKEVSNTK